MIVKSVYVPFLNGKHTTYEVGDHLSEGNVLIRIIVVPLESGLIKVTLCCSKGYRKVIYSPQVVINYEEMEEKNYKDED